MRNVIIIGALGRAFHNFNVYFKNNHDFKVVAFVSNEADAILDKTYPIQLTGKYYPNGIPIEQANDLVDLIKKHDVAECIISDSNIPQDELLTLSSVIQSAGSDVRMLGANTTMLEHLKPVIGVCGSGKEKTQLTCKIVRELATNNLKSVVIKHPVPSGDIKNKITQRIAEIDDINVEQYPTVEDEEVKQLISCGTIVYTGIDFHDVLNQIGKESVDYDVIIWENAYEDMPFIRPDLLLTIISPDKFNNNTFNYPIDINLRSSDVVLIDKVAIADPIAVAELRKKIINLNANATIVEAASPFNIEDFELIRDKDVLLVKCGQNATINSVAKMAALKFGANRIVNDGQVFSLTDFSVEQFNKLEFYIDSMNCDLVLLDAPFNLSPYLKVNKQILHVNTELQELGTPNVKSIISAFITKHL